MKTQGKKMMMICFIIAGTFGMMNAQSFMDPVFTASTESVDFGNVDSKTDSGYRTITFTNTGGAPLLITNIIPSCGCTVPEWSKEAIKPGKSSEIKVKYDISRIGLISKTITVVTNEPDGKDADGNIIYKKYVIPVKGTVK
jgi:hypothetical protein